MRINFPFNCVRGGLLVLAAVIANSASAAIIKTVTTNNTPDDADNGLPVSSTDLINQGQPTLLSAVHTGYTPFSSGGFTTDVTTTNDGSPGDPSIPFPASLDSVAFDNADGAWVSTFNLNLAIAPLGYRIDEVDVFSGWPDNRAGQSYTLEYSLVGSASFTSLGTFSTSGVDQAVKSAITDNTLAPLASGVDAIRLTFAPQGIANVIREVDVIGSIVPEPSSLALLLVGCLSFFRLSGKRSSSKKST